MSARSVDRGDGTAAEVLLLAWRSFICRACGLVYDEALGDPDSGLAPGTRFEDIPEDWSCPLCGVTKADFEPHDADPSTTPALPARRAAPAPRTGAGIVIVGAGRAGWAAAAALRERDLRVPITLVAASDGDVYDKPTLSVAWGRGIAPDRLVRETGAAAADRLGVRLLPHTVAVRIDRAAARLRTTRGTLRYASLVLAHGAEPRPSPRLPPTLCWRINDLAAYQGLRRALGTQRRHVVVVGAGLVGCELADDLARGGHGVTLLDTADRPLASQLPPRASARLLEAWRSLPLRFVGGISVARLERIEGMVCLTTECGLSFESDQVIAATGLQPADRLAAQAGLRVDAGGVAVAAGSLRTSDPRIHALGDCASIDGRAQRFIEPIGRQARAIAGALLGDGGDAFAPGPVPLRIKTGAMPFTLHGTPRPAGRWEVEDDSETGLRMVQREGDDVVARLEGTLASPSRGPAVPAIDGTPTTARGAAGNVAATRLPLFSLAP